MISPDSRTRKWIDQCRKNLDPELAEKMILAFMLTESLKTSGLDFIFKGGTPLSIITGNLSRFSIDVDIIVSPGSVLTAYFKHITDQGVFTRYEEDVRAGDIPVKLERKRQSLETLAGTKAYRLSAISFYEMYRQMRAYSIYSIKLRPGHHQLCNHCSRFVPVFELQLCYNPYHKNTLAHHGGAAILYCTDQRDTE